MVVALVACAGKTPTPETAPATKEAYWKRAFPNGATFEKHSIPADQLAEADTGNNVFVEVSDAEGSRLGYLRDFVGPVSTHGACPCDPINVTLIFDPAGTFTSLISPQPLSKYGHEEMTPQEVERLIGILRDPPAELLEVRELEDLVDATSGATKAEYKEFVVNRAALETRRLVQIVQDSEALIAGAPIADDLKLVNAVLAQPESLQRAHALAELLDKLTSDAVLQRAYIAMSRDYLASLAKADTLDETIDARILDDAIADRVGPGLQADVCYRLASERAALSIAERCARSLSRYEDAAPIVALIQGTTSYFREDYATAAAALDAASWRFDVQTDASLHARLAGALIAIGKTEQGCTKALLVRRAHPLLPETKMLMERCKKADKHFAGKIAAAEKEDRELFLGLQQNDGPQIPVIDVDDARLQPVKLAAGEPGKISVIIYFATWCPHCQAELPKVSAFAERVAKDAKLKDRVRVIGVRTALERETETYESFNARFKIPFPVYSDTAMSSGYSAVVKATNVNGGFPMLLVADESGKLRYDMPAGEWRDTAVELEWAVRSLVK